MEPNDFQIVESLLDEQEPEVMELRVTIETSAFCFPKGMTVMSKPDRNGKFTIWPVGQKHAYVVNIPRWTFYSNNRNKRRRQS